MSVLATKEKKTVPGLVKSCPVDNVAAVDDGADVGELKTGSMKHVDESTSSNEARYRIIGPMM